MVLGYMVMLNIEWIDNFHTGFNLVAIKDIQRDLDINEFNENINKGFNFHINNHFTDDLLPKYYDNSLYPIDIHNFAQGIDTFIEYEQFEKADKLIKLAIERMG